MQHKVSIEKSIVITKKHIRANIRHTIRQFNIYVRIS